MSAPGAGNRRRRGLGAIVTLLFVLLPALVGGARLDAPARPGEQARLQRATGQAPSRGPRSMPVDMYLAATAPPVVAEPAAALARARLASVVGLGVLSALLYLLLSAVRGRACAVLACAALACLPPVAYDGAALRPELPAAVFAALGMLLFIGAPHALPGARRAVRGWLVFGVLAAAVAGAFGLAAACLPDAGILLLVPGGVLLLVVATHLLRGVRLVRRRSIWRLPTAALNRRLLPWVALVGIGLVGMLAVLAIAVEGDPRVLPASRASVGLLPASWLPRAALLVLAAFGALRLLLVVGLRLGRRRRVEPATLLAIWVAVLLMQRALGSDASDALLAAAPLAALVAEGAMLVLLVALGFAVRSPQAAGRARNIA